MVRHWTLKQGKKKLFKHVAGTSHVVNIFENMKGRIQLSYTQGKPTETNGAM